MPETQLIELTTSEKRKKRECIKQIDEDIDTFMVVGRCLVVLREEQLFRDEAEHFTDFCKKRWPQHFTTAYRQIAGYEAATDVEGTLLGKEKLPGPSCLATALEVSKVEGQTRRADLWVAVHKDTPAEKVTAAKVRKKRNELFGANENGAPAKKKATGKERCIASARRISHLQEEIVELSQQFKKDSKSWQTILTALENARKSLGRLAK